LSSTTTTATWAVVTASPDETRDLGRALAAAAEPGAVILLSGPLGAGKTCLASGILAGLGGGDIAPSPTFVLIREYDGRLPVYHFDAYRLEDPEQAADLGVDEYFYGDGVSVVEWPENLGSYAPKEALWVRIERPAGARSTSGDQSDETRRFLFRASGQRAVSLLEEVRRTWPTQAS